jgi:hypothetical protein
VEQAAKFYDFFRTQGFSPVGRESYGEFQNYQHESVLLDLSATLINTWGFVLNSVYKNIYNHLCVAWFCDGSPFHGGVPVYFTVLRPSAGTERKVEEPGNRETLKKTIETLYDLALEAGLPFLPVESVEEGFLKDFTEIEGFEVNTDYSIDHNEYVYKTKDLAEWSGGINLNKRNRIKKFLNKPNIELRPMDNKNVGLCLEIQKEWCLHRDCPSCESFAGCEKKALEIMIEIFDEGVYNGIFGYIDAIPVGYAVWEKKNETLAYLYFGKANVQDFFAYLIYEIARERLPGVEYFNIGEDMGNLGLRTFKKHMGVHELWKKYLCVFKRRDRGL